MKRRQWSGAFAEWLHIRPWEMDLLTAQQFEDLVKYLQAKNDDQ